jgi:membrane fusion protein
MARTSLILGINKVRGDAFRKLFAERSQKASYLVVIDFLFGRLAIKFYAVYAPIHVFLQILNHLPKGCWQMSLFRPEIIESQKIRLHGNIMLTQPPSVTILTALIFAIVGAIALWINLGHYARSEMVMGRVVPTGLLIRIVPTRTGLVQKLSVSEGSAVKAGQQLLVIIGEQGTNERVDPAGEGLRSIDQQHAFLNQQIGLSQQSALGEATKMKASAGQLKSQIASFESQIALQQRLVKSTKDSFDPLTEAVKKGFYSRIQFEGRRQAWLGQQEQLVQLRAQKAQLESQLVQTLIELAQLPITTLNRAIELKAAQADLIQKRIEVENSRSYVLTTPIAGRVSALQVSLGSSVTSQLPLMSIMSENAEMQVELYAPSRAIGFARKGQEVRLMFDAFPYQRFGSFFGRISEISKTVLAPNEIDAPIATKEPVYRVRVSLARQSISAFGDTVPLQPGMTLTANIVLERRSFFDWLLEPINAVRNRS